MAKHELVTFSNGTISIRNVESGQAMHSLIGPWEEATRLYSLQSRLRERIAEGGPPLELWDVGMGIAANAIAAAACASPAGRELSIHSFESDLEGLEMALASESAFPFLKDWRPALRSLLECGEWRAAGVEWRLWRGDFFDRLREAPAPEIVFWDFYAPVADPDLWNVSAFTRLRARCVETDLYTYVSSKAPRAALLLAGWFVGHGEATDMKAQTTIASTQLARIARPLGADWLESLDRSPKPAPNDWPGSRDELLARLRAHPQFSTVI